MTLLRCDNAGLNLERKIFFAPFNLTVGDGETVMLKAEVGSGKSLLMKLLSGITAPTKGEIYFEDEKFYYNLDSGFFRQRASIMYLLEGSQPLANLSAFDNIALYYRVQSNWSEDEIYDKVLDKLSRVDLVEKSARRPTSLSMEENILINVLMNLKENSKIIFIDEIFTLLSEENIRKVKRLLLPILQREKVTVIACKDDIEYLEIPFQKVIEIRDRQVFTHRQGIAL